MNMARQRIHNEYFRSLKKTTCDCGEKKTQVYSWGEYVRVCWRSVAHFCVKCFATRVLNRLITHKGECGCGFELVWKGSGKKPEWLKVEEPTCKVEEKIVTDGELAAMLANSPWEQAQRQSA